jgi:hypothetical protein
VRTLRTAYSTELIAGSQVLCELGFYLGASIGT